MKTEALPWDELLAPYLAAPLSEGERQKLQVYLDLLLRWNARLNLTSVREPSQIVTRHLGESLFIERHVPRGTQTLLDHGSGGGFPGIPIAVRRPELSVTLSEVRHKKVAFLQECLRKLNLRGTIWGKATEELPKGQIFDCITSRAVKIASPKTLWPLLAPGGTLIIAAGAEAPQSAGSLSTPIPNSTGKLLLISKPSIADLSAAAT